MGEKIREWLGLKRQNTYIKDYFYQSNAKSSIYMALIVIPLEIWMIFRLIRSAVTNWQGDKTVQYLIRYGKWYLLLIICAIALLAYSISYLRGMKDKILLGQLLLWAFTISALVFGIHFGFSSFEKGEQILAFLTMVIFVLCLLIWNPVISFLLSVCSFGGFYLYMIAYGPAEYVTDGLKINFLTMWISTFVVALSLFHQRLTEAKKDESLEKVNEYLERISMQDELTEIPNMRWFKIHAKEQLKDSSEHGKTYQLIFINIENYKSYNAKYGFEAGDELLCNFAKGFVALFGHLPTARYSDDHFVALCPSAGCKVLIEKTGQLLHSLQKEVKLELKAGIFNVTKSTDLDLACDRARYAANSIRKRYDQSICEYDEKLDEKFMRMQYIINNIDAAIENDYIKVFYQPVIDSRTGTLCGMEALSRWIDPKHGMMPPGMFIEILEEYRQIHKLDQQIIELVCRDLHELGDSGLAKIPVSLNFSQLDFDLYDVPKVLTDKANKYQVPLNMLDVEITESALNGNADKLIQTMDIMHNMGYSQWLDDFGSGYSSLNVLVDYKFDVLKIDMVFLRRFNTNEKSKVIIKSIVDLAKNLGMVTLTEGVETKEQADFLTEIGCDKLQGYYFGKPMPHDEIIKCIEEGKLKLPEFN